MAENPYSALGRGLAGLASALDAVAEQERRLQLEQERPKALEFANDFALTLRELAATADDPRAFVEMARKTAKERLAGLDLSPETRDLLRADLEQTIGSEARNLFNRKLAEARQRAAQAESARLELIREKGLAAATVGDLQGLREADAQLNALGELAAHVPREKIELVRMELGQRAWAVQVADQALKKIDEGADLHQVIAEVAAADIPDTVRAKAISRIQWLGAYRIGAINARARQVEQQARLALQYFAATGDDSKWREIEGELEGPVRDYLVAKHDLIAARLAGAEVSTGTGGGGARGRAGGGLLARTWQEAAKGLEQVYKKADEARKRYAKFELGVLGSIGALSRREIADAVTSGLMTPEQGRAALEAARDPGRAAVFRVLAGREPVGTVDLTPDEAQGYVNEYLGAVADEGVQLDDGVRLQAMAKVARTLGVAPADLIAAIRDGLHTPDPEAAQQAAELIGAITGLDARDPALPGLVEHLTRGQVKAEELGPLLDWLAAGGQPDRWPDVLEAATRQGDVGSARRVAEKVAQASPADLDLAERGYWGVFEERGLVAGLVAGYLPEVMGGQPEPPQEMLRQIATLTQTMLRRGGIPDPELAAREAARRVMSEWSYDRESGRWHWRAPDQAFARPDRPPSWWKDVLADQLAREATKKVPENVLRELMPRYLRESSGLFDRLGALVSGDLDALFAPEPDDPRAWRALLEHGVVDLRARVGVPGAPTAFDVIIRDPETGRESLLLEGWTPDPQVEREMADAHRRAITAGDLGVIERATGQGDHSADYWNTAVETLWDGRDGKDGPDWTGWIRDLFGIKPAEARMSFRGARAMSRPPEPKPQASSPWQRFRVRKSLEKYWPGGSKEPLPDWFRFTLHWEGGRTVDQGGKTNSGLTSATLQDMKQLGALPPDFPEDPFKLSEKQVAAAWHAFLYRYPRAAPVVKSDLPDYLKAAYVDMLVNAGPRAALFLRRAMGSGRASAGIFHRAEIEAMGRDPARIARRLNELRAGHFRRLRGQYSHSFGGWMNRLRDLNRVIEELAP